jgi:glycosyltransferase involved in cell wall biosynthesis
MADPPDVIHYPLTVPVPRLAGTPNIVTLHDVQHEALPELFSRAERTYRDWVYRSAATRADVVTTPSLYSGATISEHYGIPPERIRVIPWGVDLDRFSASPAPDDDEVMRSLGVPDRFVFYPANLWPHKNHRLLLNALAARSYSRDLDLVMTGATYQRLGDLRRHAAELGLAQRFHHLGYVPADALPVLYRRAAALVYPSLYEGFGMPLLEAAACGCPVAASRGGSIEEVAGEAAVYFDPRDVRDMAAVIDRVVTDESLRASLRDAGRLRAARFPWEATADGFLAAYRLAADGQASKKS